MSFDKKVRLSFQVSRGFCHNFRYRRGLGDNELRAVISLAIERSDLSDVKVREHWNGQNSYYDFEISREFSPDAWEDAPEEQLPEARMEALREAIAKTEEDYLRFMDLLEMREKLEKKEARA